MLADKGDERFCFPAIPPSKEAEGHANPDDMGMMEASKAQAGCQAAQHSYYLSMIMETGYKGKLGRRYSF